MAPEPATTPAMWREIHQQPTALADTLALYVDRGELRADFADSVGRWMGDSGEIVIAASGTSRHAALYGKGLIEALAATPVQVAFACEYGLSAVEAQRDPAVMVLSQSGETADTLAALRRARDLGRRTLSVTNVAGSTLAREAQVALATAAGTELAIPATKSFTTQLVVMHLIALAVARHRGRLGPEGMAEALAALAQVPDLVAAQLAEDHDVLANFAIRCADASPLVYLGRGLSHGLACEGALKLKETAYVPAEAMPAGEFRHGPIAMLGEQAALVVLATYDPRDPASVNRRQKTLQLLTELDERGVAVLVIANLGDEAIARRATRAAFIPPLAEPLAPFPTAVLLQLLAYYCARRKGVDVDRPRHLTKSVRT